MPRRKAAEVELLPPEDDQPSRGRKKLVEAEHTIKYSAPVPVTVEDDPAEDNTEEDFDLIEEEKAKRRKKTARDEREDLRREMDKLGVASASRLKLSIDKYRHSDSDDSGTLAEKDFCTKDAITKEHILSDDYLAVARKYGPGRYWFTLRMDNKIIRQWERKVNAAVTPSGPVIQSVNPNDPNSPQVIFQSTSDSQQAMPSLKEVWKAQREALKEQLEMAKLMREAYGLESDKSDKATTTGATSDPEIVFVSNLLTHNEKAMEKISNGILGKLFGKNAIEDDTSWSAVGMEAVKSGQLGVAIEAAFKGLSGLINMILPQRGNNNGQAQMAQTPAASMENQQGRDPQSVQHVLLPTAEGQGHGAVQEGVGGIQGTQAQGTPGQQQQVTPAEQALATVIADCQKKVPPQITFTNLMTFADAINDQVPAYSIDGWIEYFGGMPVDGAIDFVKTLPNGEQIASLPHAKEWTEALQKLIKESQEREEE